MQQALVSLPTSPDSRRDSLSTTSAVIYHLGNANDLRNTILSIEKQLSAYSIRVIQLADVTSIDEKKFSQCYRLVLLPVRAGLPVEQHVYQSIERLSRSSLKVICFVDCADEMPLSEKCRLLLAGALSILESASAESSQELHQLLLQLFTSDANRRAEEASLKLQMKSFGIVGESAAILRTWRWLLRAGPLSSLPVLITGETGTGKNLLANALRQLDPERCKGPFVVLNCSAVNPLLIESELFGHRRGAFTGAERDRMGLFRSADGGVLFLDEIGDLDLALQAKLLRVLQENRVLGVGQDHEVAIRTRVVAATNRNLKEMVRENKFRADLFHRLDILSIHVPPLRQRLDDLRPLLEHFLQKYRMIGKGNQLSVQDEVVEALLEIELPGNARQLENIVRQALVNKESDESLRLSDLTSDIWRELSAGRKNADEPNGHSANTLPGDDEEGVQTRLADILDAKGWNLSRSMEYCEKLLLSFALRKSRGIQSQTSKLLGITPRTLYSKIRKYDLLRH
jgi:transcriptional regulator with GAF, ATPase, and Fis domain